MRNAYRDFEAITRDALDFALAAEGFSDPALARALMASFRRLEPYPDAEATLHALRARGIAVSILSNGTPAMLAQLIEGRTFSEALDPVLSVDSVKVFKPDARVYRLGAEALGLPPERIGFVSANAWDAAGAAGFGFSVFWINRNRQPVEYRLAENAVVLADLGALAGAIALR